MSADLEFITDWVERALALLVQQFKTKDDFKKFLECLLEEAQVIENVAKDLYFNRRLENAIGEQLDGIGQIVALERQGLDDDKYRDALKFQILLNASKGDPEILILALKEFTQSTIAKLYELFPAACYGEFSSETFDDFDTLNKKMQDLCAGSVKWLGSIIGNDQPFIFDQPYAVPPDTDEKYGGFAIVNASNEIIDDGYCGKFTIFS